jgi:4-hydroxymandelate oxidase
MSSPSGPREPSTSDLPAGGTARLEGDLFGLQEQARAHLQRGTFDYVAGGADDEVTLRDNVAAWSALRIKPMVLQDVSAVDASTRVLGQSLPCPVLVAPVAYQRLVHPEGEVATAIGAAAAHAIMIVSTRSSVSVTDVARLAPGARLWFQAYVMSERRRTAALVEAAVEAGCSALVLTVDTPALGRRRRDERNHFRIPDDLGGTHLDPGAAQSPAVVPEDVSWISSISGLPVVAKGVLSGEAARRCLDAGASAVVVSNHGGRQLDGVVATADVLAEVVDAVGDRTDVLVDGGIRRGSDVLKALALGARAVLVGRPVIWGLATGGAEGVTAVIEHLHRDLVAAMVLCGAPTPAHLGRGMIVARAHHP